MKVHPDTGCDNDPRCTPGTLNHTGQSHNDMAGISDNCKHLFFHNHLQDEPRATFCRSPSESESRFRGTECIQASQGLCNGASATASSHCIKSDRDATDGVTENTEDSRSSPDVCSSSAADDDDDDDDDFTPEVQQAYKIYHSFLLEKHKAVTAPFWHPIGPGEHHGNDMCFKKIDDKFVSREYESITEFVADFRLMLENCYRYHGVDHWISKQAQKLEIILEQKLTLLSRSMREKTTLTVTSRGRFGTEDEKGAAGTSSRRRSVPRNLAAITVGGCESIMVQALRLEEHQRAKEEKRLRELEKKEAEEASAKEVEEWERCLLSLAEPWPISTMWELPAIGHFLCLAQTALNLPEIVFFELERCLLMPRCNSFLAKVMTSLLCQPHRRVTLHRRPALPYRRWEAELRQKVLGWYQAVGRAEDQVARAEQLGLCHRFFWILGETSPLEKMAFHLLPFNQRVWLLKGLCDNVYETQRDIQDAVLGQPIHECRESILGYDSQENAYIHFPHFCGADLRIYCQSPCGESGFPLLPFHVKKLQCEAEVKECTSNSGSPLSQHRHFLKDENEDSGERSPWTTDNDSHHDMDDNLDNSNEHRKKPNRYLIPCKEESPSSKSVKEEPIEEQRVKLKEQDGDSDCKPFLRVGENCNSGRSANFLSTDTLHFLQDMTQKEPSCQDRGCCPRCSVDSDAEPEHHSCFCFKAEEVRTGTTSPRQGTHSGAEMRRMHSKRKRKKRKKEKLLGVKAGTGKLGLRRIRQTRASKGTLVKATTSTTKSKDKRKILKLGRKFDPKKAVEQKERKTQEFPVEPTFKLVCTSLDELRDLISKTEDELDELESTKKKCGRWYFKRESVKELHITLIRLLNELLPWETKLVKAFQRNRVRLKKESDDFMKHLENETFIREEWVRDAGDGGACTKGFSSVEISREVDDEDKTERNLKDDTGMTEHESQLGSKVVGHPKPRPEISGFGPVTRSSKHQLSSGQGEDFSPSRGGKLVIDDSVEPQCEVTSNGQNTSMANPLTTERASAITTLLGSVQGRCKPIQALLAKSVGNKVTLMSHPQAITTAQVPRLPDHTLSAAVPPTKAVTSCMLAPVTTVTHTPVTSSAPESPVKVVYNIPEGLSLVKKDGSSFKFSVQPVVDQKPSEELMQQVIILPSNLVIQRTEETKPVQPYHATSPTTVSTTPGFALPENKIPVQPVAPLKGTRIAKTSSPAVSPSLQKVTPCRALPTGKRTAEPHSVLNRSSTPVSNSTHLNKCDTKQELKTVCIRDSQSILVTTRGGNTGVVKVQTSDKSGACPLPSSPVFNIPHQFHAFFVSSATETATAQAPHSTSTAKLLPIVSSLNDKTVSIKSTPQSFKCVNAVSPSQPTCSNVVSIPDTQVKINSLLPVLSQNSTGAPSTVSIDQVIPLTTAFKSPQKRSQASSLVPEESPLQKVFLVTPTASTSASTSITTAPAQGSRVMFMNQSASACSTVTVPKGPTTSNSTTTTVEIIKVRPNIVQATGSTTTGTLTKVHGINISGLSARTVDEGQVSSKSLTPLTEAATNAAPVTVSSVLATSSSGLIFVQNCKPTASSCPSLNVKGPVKATGSADSKNVMFSTYGTGHMASSALLSAVHHKSESSTAAVVGSSVKPLGTLGNTDISLPRSLTTDKSWVTTSLTTALYSVKPTISTAVPSVSTPLTLGTATACTPSPVPQPCMTSVVRASVNPISGSTTVQEKVVINTTAPLAPGTQLLINNFRFVVPAQGLGSGSHVLLISSPTDTQGTRLVPPIHRGTGTHPVLSVPQSPRMVPPGMQSYHTSVRMPAPTTAKGRSIICTNSALAHASQLESVISPGQGKLTSIVRLPSFLAPEVKECLVATSCDVTSSSKEMTDSSGMVIPAVLQTGLVRTSPVVTKPPMNSTVSRMQSLPVATVLPIGNTINSQATPVAAVPPSVNTVIMAPCPGRAVKAGSIRMPVVVTQPPQVQGKSSEQVPGTHTIHTPSKLLLSPDGAILNVVRCPALQSLPVITNTVTAQVVVPTCHSVTGPVLNTIDSQRILTSLHPERSNR